MQCPSCSAEAKLTGDVLACKTCGPMKQNAAGEWEPCEAPANPPDNPPGPAASPSDAKPVATTPPLSAQASIDPDDDLFIRVPLGGD